VLVVTRLYALFTRSALYGLVACSMHELLNGHVKFVTLVERGLPKKLSVDAISQCNLNFT
jgi:hypothetical protein